MGVLHILAERNTDMDSTETPENIVKRVITKVSYECTNCRSVIHIGEYEEPYRADLMLTEWIARHPPDHRYSY